MQVCIQWAKIRKKNCILIFDVFFENASAQWTDTDEIWKKVQFLGKFNSCVGTGDRVVPKTSVSGFGSVMEN